MGWAFPDGTVLGRYEIRHALGEGGMGQVFLAHDNQLNRPIALKILSVKLGSDPQQSRRFMQEAQAASALSHPNVAHIYEIGQFDDLRYIAMEYVEGQRLDFRIAGRPLPISELVEFGIQIADALDEAHSKGITHRDIKSSNIMITPRRQVKVLDFGLAKVTPPVVAEISGDSGIPTRVRTNPGVVMGTVNYMSPEQALGRDIDHRTDIFSLGVVLYEMATGRVPFAAESPTETIDRIAHAQPDPIARFNYEFPIELETIIKKAMRKDRDERYQTMHDLLVDLRSFKNEYEVLQRLENLGPRTENDSARKPSTLQPRSATAEIQYARPTSSAEYIVTEIKRHKLATALAIAVGLVVVIGGGLLLLRTFNKPVPPTTPAISFARLTGGGRIGNELIVGGAAISPDGKYVVLWTEDREKDSCYVRQVSTNSLVKILGPSDLGSGGTTFSPDGEFIYFTGYDKNNSDGALFKVPVLGGTPQKILEGIWSPVSFSPDGKQIAYVRLFPATGESWLVIANADGSGAPRTIAKRTLPDYYSKDGPAWSPDAKRVAVGANRIPEILNAKVVEVSLDGGPEHDLTRPQWSSISRLAWINDGSGLVVGAFDSFSSTGTQLWFVSSPDGASRRITNDLNGYGTVSLGLTADSKTIVTVQEDFARTIWRATPYQDPSHAQQISAGKYEGILSLDTTKDGRIVYLDYAGNGNEVWIMKADGSEKKQLTSDGASKVKISVTADDRYVLFNSNRSGSFNIWRVDLDGNNEKQLTSNESFAIGAVSSDDGIWILYQSLREGKWRLWKMPIDGGEATKFTEKQCALPSVSPDGRAVACLAPDERASLKWQIAIISTGDGTVSKLIDLPATLNFSSGLVWSPDGKSIAYVDSKGSASNIYNQPIDGSPRKMMTNFQSDRISTFAWARDSRQIFFGRGPTIDDVVLIKDFR